MEMRFGGRLPDDHPFWNTRTIIDWSFKLLSWLGITATFGIAAEITSSRWLLGFYFFAWVMLYWFVQQFVSLLFAMRFSATKPKADPAVSGTGKVTKLIKNTGRALVWIISLSVWVGGQVAMQQVVDRSVNALVNFQKQLRSTQSYLSPGGDRYRII